MVGSIFTVADILAKFHDLYLLFTDLLCVRNWFQFTFQIVQIIVVVVVVEDH